MTHILPDTQDQAFVDLQPRLFAVAYRMLGTVSDAEDIVQDAYLRWQRADQGRVHDSTGYLIRITTRLCLDHLRAAKSRREAYTGEWLPEPLVTNDATERLDRDVSIALLLSLERLTPRERAAFLLHDVFEHNYDELALALDRSIATCRQLVSRARKHVRQNKPRALVDDATGRDLVNAFFTAAKGGDTQALTQLLAQDVRLHSDGGGKVLATLNPILGRDKVIRFFAGLARKSAGYPGLRWTVCELNGQPAIVSREPGGILQAASFEIEERRITKIYMTRNPDKTRHLAQVLE